MTGVCSILRPVVTGRMYHSSISSIRATEPPVFIFTDTMKTGTVHMSKGLDLLIGLT